MVSNRERTPVSVERANAETAAVATPEIPGGYPDLTASQLDLIRERSTETVVDPGASLGELAMLPGQAAMFSARMPAGGLIQRLPRPGDCRVRLLRGPGHAGAGRGGRGRAGRRERTYRELPRLPVRPRRRGTDCQSAGAGRKVRGRDKDPVRGDVTADGGRPCGDPVGRDRGLGPLDRDHEQLPVTENHHM